MLFVRLVVTVLTISFLAQMTFTYDLQDTIKKLRSENAYLQHRLENLTQALRELRKLLDHSKGEQQYSLKLLYRTLWHTNETIIIKFSLWLFK